MAKKPFKGKGGPKPPRKQYLNVSGVEIGEVKPVGVGEFEVNINLMILIGKFPAHGAQYQWLVDGKPFGNVNTLSVSGRADGTLRLSGKKSICVSMHIEWTDNKGDRQTYRPTVKDIPLPEQLRKLELVGVVPRENDELEVVLRRVGKDGKGEKGYIGAWYWRKEDDKREWALGKWEVKESDGHVVLALSMFEAPSVVEFFIQEDSVIKSPKVLIPAKSPPTAPPQIPPPPKPKKTAAESYANGREFVRKIFS